jgi:light-regulated signal transduction histidine kinase (bacteriophytochrome)
LIDITERKHGEKQLQAANVELEQRAQALTGSNSELQKFAYVASHDLQEPLRTITSYSQLIQKRYGGKLDEKADRYLNFVADAAIRMQQLIEDLLNYSRVSTEERPLQRTDCGQILAQVLANLHAAIVQSKALVTWGPLPTLDADPSQLVELFQNLISNAVKFQGEKQQRVHISATREGEEWVFCVRDNGIGIDPQYSERIFVIFQRLHTREQYQGTGIGLAICKRIIERHNGRIWLESQPQEGTAFFFTLPARV